MEAWIDELFSHDLLQEAASRYGADATNAKKLGDFENYVFEVTQDGTPMILRLTHSSHRSKIEVESELKWVNYLHSKGIRVSLVHPSKDGELVEVIEVSDSSFFICLFDKAPGEPVKMNSDFFGPVLFEEWGRTTALMHEATMHYDDSDSVRLRWYEDDLINLGQYLDTERDAEIVKGSEQLVQTLKQLPMDRDMYGLIHSDIHSGNFFYHEGDIHVFDFDDTMYFYFLSDIAIPVYYSVLWTRNEDSAEARATFGEEFLAHFLRGYMSVRPLSLEWLQRLPLFLKMRDYTLYGVFHKKCDLENESERLQRLVASIGNRLKRHEPLFNVDYEKIYEDVVRVNA